MYELVPVQVMSTSQLEKRRQILDAVIRLVDRKGADATSVKAVAQESGIALGTIYRFFSTKHHLFAAAIVHWGERLADRTPPPKTGEPLDEQLVGTVRRGTHAYLRHPNLLGVMVQASVSNEPYVSEIMADLRRSTRIALVRSMPDLEDSVAYPLSELVQSLWWDLLIQWYSGRRSMGEGLELAERQVRWAVIGMTAEVSE